MNVTCACPCRAAINHPSRVEVCYTAQVFLADERFLLVFCADGLWQESRNLASAPAVAATLAKLTLFGNYCCQALARHANLFYPPPDGLHAQPHASQAALYQR
jgi:hypothetical protein